MGGGDRETQTYGKNNHTELLWTPRYFLSSFLYLCNFDFQVYTCTKYFVLAHVDKHPRLAFRRRRRRHYWANVKQKVMRFFIEVSQAEALSIRREPFAMAAIVAAS